MNSPTDRRATKGISLDSDVPIILFNELNQLEEIILDTKSERNYYSVPDSIKPGVPVNAINKIRYISRRETGKKTNLPINKFLEALFLRNEILACKQMPMSRITLTREYRKEFPNKTAGHYTRFGDRVRILKNKYNSRTLYVEQPEIILWSFPYSPKGYICHNSAYRHLISFQSCRRIVQSSKFVDPRFFTKEEIDKLSKKTKLGWRIPDMDAVTKIEKQIGKPLYDSILFPQGYTKEYDPI